jgi:hypothetical protein
MKNPKKGFHVIAASTLGCYITFSRRLQKLASPTKSEKF